MTTAPPPISKSLPALPDGWHVIGYALLEGRQLAIISADFDLGAEWRRDAAGSPLGDPWGVAAKANAKLWIVADEDLVEGPSFPLLTPFPIVDRFPDGRWLIAGVRSIGDKRETVRVLTPDGSEIRRIDLGDGIMRLKIDQAGLIWVGWFDEGVFGNDDWRVAGREWPPSGDGLAAFDEHGVVVMSAEPPSPPLAIADCYALNVAGETAYACTYMDFPIVSASAEAQSWWTTDLSGPRALAVHFPYVLAVGGYANEGDRAVLVQLDRDTGKAIGEWRLPLMLGFPDSVDLVDGRDDTIHVVNGGMWLQWRIRDFLQEVAL